MMNRSNLLIVPVMLAAFTFSLSANAQGINFNHGTWKEVMAEAKAQNKPIFVDAYATWCGPCKMMSRQTFADRTVGQFYNDEFINYKLNMETPEGEKFDEKFVVSAYPTLIYISPDGETIARIEGFLGADNFLLLGQAIATPEESGLRLVQEADGLSIEEVN